MQCRRVNGPRVELKWTVGVFDMEGRLRGLCKTMNMSGKGARLTVDKAFNLPDLFSIAFAENRTVTRHCNVIWRNDTDVGIRFVDAPKPSHLSSASPASTSTPFLI